MPDLNFLILCDHVRPDQGTMHILAAGIDRMQLEPVPSLAPLGIAASLSFPRDQVGTEHPAELRIHDPENNLVFEARGGLLITEDPYGLTDWPIRAGITLNVLIPIQTYGPHSVTLLVDGEALKTQRFFVEPPQGV